MVGFRAVRRGIAWRPATATLPVAGDGWPLVASVVSRLEADTAWFVRALPGIPADDVHLPCVANNLAVGLDGWTDGTP